MYELKKSNEIDENTRIKHYVAYGIEITLMLISLGLLIYYIAIGDPKHRLVPAIGSVLVFACPIVFEQLFKKRFSLLAHIYFSVIMFFTVFLGCALNMHATVEPYDEICHFASGYLISLALFYLLVGWKDYDKQKPIFIAFIIFAISMGLSALWEVYEFSADILFTGTALGGPTPECIKQGEALGLSGLALNLYTMRNSVLVWDTITDIFLFFIGDIIFFVQYLLHRHIKTPLMLAYVKKDRIRSREAFYNKVDEKVTCEDTPIDTPCDNIE